MRLRMKSIPTFYFKPYLFKTQINSKEKVFEKGKSVLCIAETNNLNGAREPES